MSPPPILPPQFEIFAELGRGTTGIVLKVRREWLVYRWSF